jgi:hypothetical protein
LTEESEGGEKRKKRRDRGDNLGGGESAIRAAD